MPAANSTDKMKPVSAIDLPFHAIVRSAKEIKPSITAKALSAFYGDAQVLYDVDLAIPANRVMAFIGPSGCGKSTFLKWINRMNDMVPGARASGSLRLGERDVLTTDVDVVDLRRRVGLVFQKPNPFPKTVFENVAFGIRLHFKNSRSELEQWVERALRQAALWDEVKDRLHHSALSLSGGQQQRLCIARAIATEPEVLLMDEPCSALDPAASARIEDLIFELSTHLTVVIVTHNLQQASRCSNRTAFFLGGRLIEEGETEQMFTCPAQRRTEDYVSGKFG
jgi:phosphate transport system ATP-binding protein